MRYGAEYVSAIEKKTEGVGIKKYEREELQELKTKYQIKIREHEKTN